MKRLAAQLPAFVIGGFCIAAVATGSALLTHPGKGAAGEATGSLYILGPARSLLSAGLYERADTYFHKGVPHHKEEAFHGIFHKWKESITPREHAHAEGGEIEEIMPWLRLATQSDPHNIEVYLVASFWLNSECQRNDLAQQAIQEAIEKNPERYELPLELARLQLSGGEYGHATASFDQALALVTRPNQKDPDQAAIDLPTIYMAQSYVYEALGQREQAIHATREFLALRSSEHFADRLEKLESGMLDPEAAKARLGELFQKEHSCERDDHDHDHDHECDEHCTHADHAEHVHGPDCDH